MSEAKHTPGQAQLLQQEREAADLENHRARLAWLSAERPRWNCGALVDAHSRHVLTLQSKDAIAKAST
jgi:hypothetical protein